MAEGLQTQDGKKVDVDKVEQDFARAMASDPDGTEATDLPKKTPEPEAEKAAPKRRRRPNKNERARTAKTAPADQKSDKDFSDDLVGLTSAVWLATASVPFTQPYAAVLKLNQPQLVNSLNAAAQNNAKVRAQIEKFTSGGGGLWAMQLAVCGANMAMQSWQVMTDPQLRAQMAESTRNDLKDFLKAQGMVIPEAEAQDGSAAG
jgi:hypothetical protein